MHMKICRCNRRHIGLHAHANISTHSTHSFLIQEKYSRDRLILVGVATDFSLLATSNMRVERAAGVYNVFSLQHRGLHRLDIYRPIMIIVQGSRDSERKFNVYPFVFTTTSILKQSPKKHIIIDFIPNFHATTICSYKMYLSQPFREISVVD